MEENGFVQKIAKISFIVSLLCSLLFTLLLLFSGNSLSIVLFSFVFILGTLFIIIFLLVFSLNLLLKSCCTAFHHIRHPEILLSKERKLRSNVFKTTKESVTKIGDNISKLSSKTKHNTPIFLEKVKDYCSKVTLSIEINTGKLIKMVKYYFANICTTCHKPIGTFWNGSYKSIMNRPYCYTCAKKVKEKLEKDDYREKKRTLNEEQLDTKCSAIDADMLGIQNMPEFLLNALPVLEVFTIILLTILWSLDI